MIKSWLHKGLQKFYETGSKAGIQPKHANTLSLLLFQLAGATNPKDMDTPGNYLHKLAGDLHDYFSVRVSGNWRIIFKFEGNDAILVDYLDYH